MIDNEFLFLDHQEFNVKNEDLNYSTLQMNDSDDEFRARVFAYNWVIKNKNEDNLKPFTVNSGNEDLGKTWKNYLVLLVGPQGENKVIKVCFPYDMRDNFAIITELNKNCSTKIEKINEYKIMDSETEKDIKPKKNIRK